MCGICGIYNLDGKPVEQSSIQQMTTAIRHRGPDDEGYLLVNTMENNVQHLHGADTIDAIRADTENLSASKPANLAIGHRRLSIIDLSSDGHQPMSTPDGNCWIAYNGEIYNYLELRDELAKTGCQFRTNSDTEVILQAYLHWGENCVEHFNGMFAFSIWDQKDQKLFCARDRLGIKPLYYFYDENTFIWASEIKQLIISGSIPINPNYKSIWNYLLLSRQDLTEETFFNNIVTLKPGHTLKIDKRGFSLRKYWDLNADTAVIQLSEQQYAEQFLELFSNSVKLRMRSDVPLGISLSGGLDSSSIAMIASELTSKKVNTFSVYYEDDPKYDERQYIRSVLNAGNFDPVYFTAHNTIDIANIKNWIYHQDEPPSSASPFSAYNNYRNVNRAGVTVVLNGQGGDEILAGYHTYFKYYYLSMIKQARFLKFSREFSEYTTIFKKDIRFKVNMLSKLLLRSFLPDHHMKRFEKHEKTNLGIYTSDFLRQGDAFKIGSKYRDPLKNNLYQTVTSTMIPHLLHWEDRNSMAHSIESRVPFLDHNLIEFIFAIPNEQKIRGSETKYVLRQAMKEILPEDIRTRQDKVGFATPTDLWTKNQLHSEILDIINSTSFNQRGLFNTGYIQKSYTRDPEVFKPNEIWKLFSIELWFRQFIDQGK
jgi:asparagine synthase (glutamine-hydrolysing)